MATGRSTKLTGALGEYLVAAELSRRGLVAAPFAGNVPHFDILAAGQDGSQFCVQVKTSNGANWQFDVRSFLKVDFDGERQIPGRAEKVPIPGLICVLVLVAPGAADRFFVMKWTELRDLIVSKYKAYLAKHGGTRPRSPQSFHTKVDLCEVERSEDAWERVLR